MDWTRCNHNTCVYTHPLPEQHSSPGPLRMFYPQNAPACKSDLQGRLYSLRPHVKACPPDVIKLLYPCRVHPTSPLDPCSLNLWKSCPCHPHYLLFLLLFLSSTLWADMLFHYLAALSPTVLDSGDTVEPRGKIISTFLDRIRRTSVTDWDGHTRLSLCQVPKDIGSIVS